MKTRVRLGAPRAPFVSTPDRIARITFAWLDDEGPVLVGSGPYRTVVVVWPTDAQGYVDVAAVRAGGAQVLAWDISSAELDAASALFRVWDLARHDVLVGGGPVAPRWSPTPETLRGSVWWPDLSQEQIAQLAGEDTARTNADIAGANDVRTAMVRTAN